MESGSLQLTQLIKKEAIVLGFQTVGIAPASALHARQETLAQWVRDGFSGHLQYMEAFFDRQTRLKANVPDIKSIVVVTIPYSDNASPALQSGTGRIARYAWGRDYHRTIDKRLKKLESFIRTQVTGSIQIVRSVDTAPLQERALAEMAGLGFFGKNTCLIQPKGGSYFFLGSLLTNLELTPDQPIQWDCGACMLCLKACPTRALVHPYKLDARRCISYLTIEFKGAVEPELKPLIDEWLFGCDICQEVCPYNRKADLTPQWKELKPQAGAGTQYPLKELLGYRSENQFLEHLAGTPLMRAKRSGLLRNAAIVAGNSRDPTLVEPLGEALSIDSSPLVRQHAAWALGKIGSPEAVQYLQKALQQETDPVVSAEIQSGLKSISILA